MTRRELLAGSALLPSLFAAGPGGVVKPKPLREGSTVGVITPATYVSDPDRIALAGKTLAYFGLKLKMGRNVEKRYGYVGGSIDERISDLHDMFRDPQVDGVACHFTVPEIGGWAGWAGFAEERSETGPDR